MPSIRYSARELYEMLCSSGESGVLEAKEYDANSLKGVMETICAFSNDIGGFGGYILLGIREERISPIPQFVVVGVNAAEKALEDIASLCGTTFNRHIYPDIRIEQIDQKKIIVIRVEALHENEKPLFLLKYGLPKGAYRRIGSTDQRCNSESLRLFYQNQDTDYDRTPVKGASVNDVDEDAVKQYKRLRAEVAPDAEELTYSTAELMEALNCVNPENKKQLNLAGVLVFGTKKLQRLTLPTERIDYIRMPGNEWLGENCDTYQFVEIEGPLITTIYTLLNTIKADISKTFLFSGNGLQAKTEELPVKVLREALVNAMMHRSYRSSRNTQVIRYDNRIEITNAGYSLKSDDDLGTPGSVLRNRVIASIFHETQLAEIKGSGIRQMNRLMKAAKLAPPIYESNRESNTFTIHILLHHFLSPPDIEWLKDFQHYDLNDQEKIALIFLREVGAIDIKAFQQIADCTVYTASKSLNRMRDFGLLELRGRGTETYYQFAVASGQRWKSGNLENDMGSNRLSRATGEKPDPAELISIGKQKTPTDAENVVTSADGEKKTTMDHDLQETLLEIGLFESLSPSQIEKIIFVRSQKRNMRNEISNLVVSLCAIRPMQRIKLASILRRSESYIKNMILKPLLDNGVLQYLYQDKINHPGQAYITNKSAIRIVKDQKKGQNPPMEEEPSF